MKYRILPAILAVFLAPLAAIAQPLADRVPDDALIYIGWRGASDPGAAYADSRLKSFIDASALPQFVNETLPKLLDKLGEKDKDAARFRDILTKFGPALWKYPTALYIGPVDGLNVLQPVPRIALLCKAGADGPRLKKDINIHLDQIPADTPLPMTAIEEDGIVSVTLGNVTPDLAGKSKTTLPYRKEFTAAMAQVGKDPLLVVYADIEQVTALIDQVANVTPQMAGKWHIIRDTVGLAGLKRLVWTAGFDGREFSTQGLILAPSPRGGVLELLDAPPLSNEILTAVPKDATMLVAGKGDFARLLSTIRTIGGKVDPAVPNAMAAGFAAANITLGMNIEEDLLKPMGEDWLAYTAPDIGGVGPLGLVIVHRPRDAAKLENSLSILERLINDRINSRNPRRQAARQFRPGHD